MASELFRKYLWLIDIVHRHGPLTFAEINRYWHQSAMYNGKNIALRTFHNHREAVDDIFHIHIACDDKTNEYYIENSCELGKNNVSNWMLNSFSMANIIHESQTLADRVIVEDIPSAQHFLTDLLAAMRKNRRVKITYRPFSNDIQLELVLQPLFVKLYQRRWYLYADKPDDSKIKIYALDSMQSVTVMEERFELPDGFSPAEYLKYAFGVEVYDYIKPCKIRIKVTSTRVARYLRALPLHHSQKECEPDDNSAVTIFEYFVAPTEDFYDAIPSHGWLEVISPEKVRADIESRTKYTAYRHKAQYYRSNRQEYQEYYVHNLKRKLLKQYGRDNTGMIVRFDNEFRVFEPLVTEYSKNNIVALLGKVAAALKKAEIVLNPGYGFMADSLMMNLAGVTSVRPFSEDSVGWDIWLPLSRFEQSFKNGCILTLETGTGGIDVARNVLYRRQDVFIIETEPGVFELTYMVKRSVEKLTVKVIEYAPLDRIRHVINKGWQPLDDETLDIFRTGRTEDVIGFSSAGMRKWLVEFQPESMSDLCLLNALYYPGRMHLYDEVLRRKQHPETIKWPRETYGIYPYQEQYRESSKSDIPFNKLALCGHTIARTMIAIESARTLTK